MTTEITITAPDNALVKATRNVKPPVKKSELLMATAIAMAKQHEQKRVESHRAKDEAEKILRAKYRIEAMKRIEDCVCSGSLYYYSGNNYKNVDLEVSVPLKAFEKEYKAWDSIETLKVKTANDFLKELRAANAGNDRAIALAADETLAAKLAKAGFALLEKRDEEVKGSINV